MSLGEIAKNEYSFGDTVGGGKECDDRSCGEFMELEHAGSQIDGYSDEQNVVACLLLLRFIRRSH